MSREFSEADMSAVVAYTRGELAEHEQIKFELRLKDDPALSAVVEDFLDGDLVLDRLTSLGQAATPRARGLPTWTRWASLAAAAAIVAMIGSRFFAERPVPLAEVRVAVLESYRVDEYLSAHSEFHGLIPSLHGQGMRGRGATEAEPNIPAREFLEIADRVERAAVDAALAGQVTGVEADYFSLPLDLPAVSSVLVLAASETEPVNRLYPLASLPMPEQLAASRLEPGIRVLPSQRVQLAAGGESIAYSRGFLVFLGEGRKRVFVGLRTAPLTHDFLDELDRLLPQTGSDTTSITALLTSTGFQVHALVVDEP